MADNELELAAELSTGFLPGGKLSARLKRTWQTRGTEMVAQIERDTGLSPEEIEEHCAADERLSDAFAAASERVIKVGDSFHREALARLVSAALSDDTLIDEVETLIDRLTTLDTISIRALAEICKAEIRFESSIRHVLKTGGFTPQSIDGILHRLESVGFVERGWEVETELPPDSGDFPASEVQITLSRTELAMRAYRICLNHLPETAEPT